MIKRKIVDKDGNVIEDIILEDNPTELTDDKLKSKKEKRKDKHSSKKYSNSGQK